MWGPGPAPPPCVTGRESCGVPGEVAGMRPSSGRVLFFMRAGKLPRSHPLPSPFPPSHPSLSCPCPRCPTRHTWGWQPQPCLSPFASRSTLWGFAPAAFQSVNSQPRCLPSETISQLRSSFWTEDQDFLTPSSWLPVLWGHCSPLTTCRGPAGGTQRLLAPSPAPQCPSSTGSSAHRTPGATKRCGASSPEGLPWAHGAALFPSTATGTAPQGRSPSWADVTSVPVFSRKKNK